MIFVSFGTHEAPFSRAIELVGPLASPEQSIVIQHGHTPAQTGLPGIIWRQYMSYQDVIDSMTAADTVICHAGVGTIMTALRLGHLPIVIPRLRQYGEHVDDHQCDIASRLAERRLVTSIGPGQGIPLTSTKRAGDADADFARAGGALREAVLGAANEIDKRRIPRLLRLGLRS